MESDLHLNSKVNENTRLDNIASKIQMMKSHVEGVYLISSVAGASDRTSSQEEVSPDFKPGNEFHSQKKSCSYTTNEIPLSDNSSFGSSSVGIEKHKCMLFDTETKNKNPATTKTPSGNEEKCLDNCPRKRHINAGSEEPHSKSSVANTSHETSYLEEISSSFKAGEKSAMLKMSCRNKTFETPVNEKPFFRFQTDDIYVLFIRMTSIGEENLGSPTPKEVSSGIPEKYLYSSSGERKIDLDCEESQSKSTIADSSDRAALLEEMSHGYKLKDGSSLPKKESSSNEIAESSSSEVLSNTGADKGSPNPATPSFCSKENYQLSASLSCSSMDNYCEDPIRYYEEDISPSHPQNFKMSYKINNSTRQIRKSEGDETNSLPTVDDLLSGTSEDSTSHKIRQPMFNKFLVSPNCKPNLGSMASSKMPTRIETDEFSLLESPSKSLSPNRIYFYDQTDKVSGEPETSSSDNDENDTFSSCSSIFDYYDDDDDLQRFCEQDKLALQTMESLKEEALKEENWENRSNSVASSTSLDKTRGTPISKIAFQDASGNTSLSMQVQEFFSNYPVNDYENLSWQECKNRIMESKYFTDEFAEHGLTMNENGVNITTEELEDDLVEWESNYLLASICSMERRRSFP